jgi:hypothetical protein
VLRGKTEDSPRQQDRLARLEPMIAAELALLRQGIGLRRQDADRAKIHAEKLSTQQPQKAAADPLPEPAASPWTGVRGPPQPTTPTP